ncbi:MAG: hypothetical protein HXX08_24360 [Chloroflexi bacterium]|uniref:Uncharacterized protein n=1 Tax=Candidatus Chlorohelix allophototropha TaxID=3003348 RepID=A0A8T7MA43_9CHLR|nr:hypothetical protein [Chloroflexota bacterium]WJW68936.1 hypothetical protein OZ401_004558 [Chloroflexota bacterium L227-S17]
MPCLTCNPKVQSLTLRSNHSLLTSRLSSKPRSAHLPLNLSVAKEEDAPPSYPICAYGLVCWCVSCGAFPNNYLCGACCIWVNSGIIHRFPISDEAVYKRLERADIKPLQALFQHISQLLQQRLEVWSTLCAGTFRRPKNQPQTGLRLISD